MTDARHTAMRDFAAEFGCDLETLHIIAGDASHRKYYRAIKAGRSIILMDAPPTKGEDVAPFIRVANYLRSVGLNAPEVFSADTNQGFLALEDLGDALFARLLADDTADQNEMYRAATDLLVHLHQQKPLPLPRYDSARMAELAALAFDWYRRGVSGEGNWTGALDLTHMLKDKFEKLEGDDVVVLRDYHAENLIWRPKSDGLLRVGLLDFQDAMLGPRAYDLVSVLQDARRDVPVDLEAAMIAHYCQGSGQDEGAFRPAYHLCGLQRNLRILGVFARLSIRDHKPSYLAFIPRVWSFIERNLAALSDQALEDGIRSALPVPTPERLDALAKVTA